MSTLVACLDMAEYVSQVGEYIPKSSSTVLPEGFAELLIKLFYELLQQIYKYMYYFPCAMNGRVSFIRTRLP